MGWDGQSTASERVGDTIKMTMRSQLWVSSFDLPELVLTNSLVDCMK